MKSIFISSAKLRMYLSEIPFIILLMICIKHNANMPGLVKLYPLIILSTLAIIFIFLFIFRGCLISKEEIRSIGLFSSRDSAVINKDKTLVLTLCQKRKLKIALFGKDGAQPQLDWLKGDDYMPVDINLYRESVVGGKRTVMSVLKYFGTPEEDLADILLLEGYEKNYGDITVTTENKNELRLIKISFNTTF